MTRRRVHLQNMLFVAKKSLNFWIYQSLLRMLKRRDIIKKNTSMNSLFRSAPARKSWIITSTISGFLDDRLAFYTFFRSDKPFTTFVEGTATRRSLISRWCLKGRLPSNARAEMNPS